MVGGRAISAVAAALAFGFLAEKDLWHIGFYVIGLMGILVIIPAVFTPDIRTKEDTVRDTRAPEEKKPLLPFVLFLIIGFIYPIALYSTNSMFGAYLHEFFDVPFKRVGIYTSVFGIGSMAGAVIGGPLLKVIGRKTGIISAVVITAAATLALSVLPGPGAGWVILAVFGIAFGYYETIYFAMGMDFCNPRIAAFMFSVIMAIGNLGIGLGMPISGILTDTVGFRNMFLVFALVHLAVLPLTVILFRKTDAPGYR
jgi:PAT family beta-lactamase induction signal transducer AmpG